MAGRGTDIRLGGSRSDNSKMDGRRDGGGQDDNSKNDDIQGDRDEVAGLGGLLVIGMGGASSRLDDQLRGRSGRQGDPGGSVFFLSMEDELITTCVPDAPTVDAARTAW